MAERRMFSKKVTNRDNFIALSSSAQALYLHLAMNADDEGFCDEVTLCMFKAHASTSDFEALVNSGHICRFESGVIVVAHWKINNQIRKDRYTETMFVKEKREYEKMLGNQLATDCQPTGNQPATDWQPTGNQLATNGKPRIDKDRLDKDRLDKVRIDRLNNNIINQSQTDPSNHEKISLEIIKSWNDLSGYGIGEVLSLDEARREKLFALIVEYGPEKISQAINNIKDSQYLQGKSGGFIITFDWFLDSGNFEKVYGNHYRTYTTTRSQAKNKTKNKQHFKRERKNNAEALEKAALRKLNGMDNSGNDCRQRSGANG